MATRLETGADFRGQKAVGLADGTNPTDAVTKAQLDGISRGLDWKNSVRAATTTAITLTGTQTVDGTALTAGDRVLVKDQASAPTNGVYVVAAGAWSRATDYDDNVEITAATAIPVEAGSVNGDAVFILTTDGAITVGTTPLAYTRLGGAGVSYTAGANGGLQLTGSAFSILLDAASGLVLGAGGVKIDRTIAGSRPLYAIDVPSGSTSATITHGFNTKDVQVQVFDIATGQQVFCDVVLTSTTVVTLTFGSTITTGQYRVVVAA